MPSAIHSGVHSSKEYAPLADEVNPPFGNVAPAPIVTNGAVVYARTSGRSSHSSSPIDETHTAPGSRELDRNYSDDLTSRLLTQGKRREADAGYAEDADISYQNRYSRAEKGKGRAWDNDDDEEDYATRSSETVRETGASSYPPLNEDEDAERRIQANLAKFTARETARRKAARTSRVMPSSTSTDSHSTSDSSSSISLARNAAPGTLSVITEGLDGGAAQGPHNKRGSLMSFVGSFKRKGDSPARSQEVELSPSPTTAQTAMNPYEPQPPFRRPRTTTSPTMYPSSPFADPPGTLQSISESLDSPVGGYGYSGPGWRGDDQEAEGSTYEGNGGPPPKERWWHALCAWGADLDGGHGKTTSNQAGRTNPFE